MSATTMTVEDVLTELEAAGSEKVRAIHTRQGASENQYGVMMGTLRAIAKRLKRRHDLGLGLWATGNEDARVLATMLLDPKKLTAAELEAMAAPLTYAAVLDKFTDYVVAASPHAEALGAPWRDSPSEFLGRAGWRLFVDRVGKRGGEGLDIDAVLTRLEAEMLAAPVKRQEAMNHAMVEIGIRLPEYRARVLAIAERLGRFDKRPVPKGCTSSYAPDWIAAVLARKKP
jgi:3-methyladenine DNA glycosylase AlkD